jgi:hypothetical protein
LAVFSLIALLALLGGMALVSLRPWEPDSLVPRVGISPEIGIGLHDSVAVAPGRRSGAGSDTGAGATAVGQATFVAKPVEATGRPVMPSLGISRARPVKQPTAATPVHTSPRPPPQPPQPPAQPIAAPVQPVAVATPPPAPSALRLVANFEEGLRGWSASVGDVFPAIVSGTVRDGSRASAVRLTSSQWGSQLIFGDGEGKVVQIQEGDAFAFGFSFYIQSMVYGQPGADNLVMRFGSEAGEDHAFGLQLWDQPAGAKVGGRGLWASGEAMGGDRFLAAVPERMWHDVIVGFVASSQGLGSYELYLDSELIDTRSGVSIIPPGAGYAQIEVGLLRDADLIQGISEIRIDAAKLADSLEAFQP